MIVGADEELSVRDRRGGQRPAAEADEPQRRLGKLGAIRMQTRNHALDRDRRLVEHDLRGPSPQC